MFTGLFLLFCVYVFVADGQTGGRTGKGGRTDGRRGGLVDGRKGGLVDGRKDGRADGRKGGRADGRKDGRADGRYVVGDLFIKP